MTEMRLCACCGLTYYPRDDDDPWEGRLRHYCLDCAHCRCDAYPAACGDGGTYDMPASSTREKL